MDFRLHRAIDEIAPAAWDALAPAQPFLSHAFLAALERTGCVGEGTGWYPAHAALWHEGELRAVAPAYFKTHSWGEYVFDWAWAEAYQRHGLDYYPKWLCAIPFTPVAGPRLLARSDEDRAALLACMHDSAQDLGVSSLHILFPDHPLPDSVPMMERQGVQFHWHNAGYADFEDFLSRLAHDKRKKIRQERRKVAEAGVTLRIVEGAAISDADWALFHRCYANTYHLHGATPYLNADFFRMLGKTMPAACVLAIASRDGQDIATSLLMRDEHALYGRYWGALEYVPCLHFEACYYTPIDYAIRHRLQTFEGGAQGEHKLARGLDPHPTRSAHWIADARFREAIERFLLRESTGMAQYIDELAEHSAYRANPN